MPADVIIAGLGAVGSASLWQLARRGVKVLGIDRFRPPHTMGSSHGQTRITRQAIGEGDGYIPLVARSHAIWRELEERSGLRLFEQCGALIIGSAGGAMFMHGRPGFVKQTVDAASRFQIPHEILTPAEAMHRFPAFRLAGDELVYFEPGGGMVYPEKCIAAQLAAARDAGAEMQFDEQVISIEQTHAAVRVQTDRQTYEASELLLAAGAWSPGLAAGQLADVSLHRQVLHWFAPEKPNWFAADCMPVFIFSHGVGAEDSFYGFPLVPGAEAEGIKMADEHFHTTLADPDMLQRTIMASEAEALHRDHLDGRMQGLPRIPLKSAACLYSCTPDMNFRVQRHAEHDRIMMASACSGHGFKHSAALGEILAVAMQDRTAPQALSFAPS